MGADVAAVALAAEASSARTRLSCRRREDLIWNGITRSESRSNPYSQLAISSPTVNLASGDYGAVADDADDRHRERDRGAWRENELLVEVPDGDDDDESEEPTSDREEEREMAPLLRKSRSFLSSDDFLVYGIASSINSMSMVPAIE